MASQRPFPGSRGFSLVEMMVALVFTLVLMAGMSSVFKSSLTTFATTGEKMANARRNRMSLDMVYDDMNNAGMYLTDLATPPAVSQTMPAFFINPYETLRDSTGTAITLNYTDMTNTSYSVVDSGANELYFYMDEPLPFEGELTASTARTASELANAGVAAAATDYTYTVSCVDDSYAKQVAAGQVFVFKDSWEACYITSVTRTGSSVTVVVGANPASAITGSGSSGAPTKFDHILKTVTHPGCGIVFIRPAQMVKYSIKPLNFDPANSTASTPCLVREQGTYNSTTFTATQPQQIVTENVVGFRVFLSADSGRTWIGGSSCTTWADFLTGISGQMATAGRYGWTSVNANNLNWFRSTPVLVRVDVTTRSAQQREEFGKDYQKHVQSVVMVPRHFGLSMN